MTPSTPLKCLVLLLLGCLGAKGLQAQALVLCLEADGGIELEMAEGTRCADRIETAAGDAPSPAFDDCASETNHCANCADFAVPRINLKTGRVETADIHAPVLEASLLLADAPGSSAPLAVPGSTVASASGRPTEISVSLRSTVLLI